MLVILNDDEKDEELRMYDCEIVYGYQDKISIHTVGLKEHREYPKPRYRITFVSTAVEDKKSEINIKEELERCDAKRDKEKILSCKFDVLYRVTEMQDSVNLNLIKTLNDDTDDRWIPSHMMDNANAIILGISRNRGRPKQIIQEGYVDEKVNSLNNKWFGITWRHKL